MSMSEFMPTILVFLMPVLLGICGLIYGMDCAIRVSQLITLERKNNTYDLLVLCPQGALAVCWVMCTSLLFQQQQFSRLREIVRTSVRIAFATIAVILLLFIGISITIVISSSKLPLPVILPLVNAEAMVVLIYTEYAQSTVIGCLIGLIISTFASGTVDAFLYAPAVFLLIKIGSYAISLLLAFGLLNGIYLQLGVQSGLMDILLTLARLVIIVAVQDVIIRILWEVVVKRTDTVPQEADLALYPQKRR